MSSSAELGDQRRIEKEDIMGDNIIYGVSMCVQENVSYLIYLDMLLDYLVFDSWKRILSGIKWSVLASWTRCFEPGGSSAP